MDTSSPAKLSPMQPDAWLSGRSISPGLGMGRAWIVGDVLKWSGPPAPIRPNEVDRELARLLQSFEETAAQLDEYAHRIEAEFDSTLAGIFRAHGEMLRDLFKSGEFERELRASLLTAEAVVGRVLLRWYRKFEAIENPTLRQRADDVLDLGRSMIRRLRGEQNSRLDAIPADSILVAERLLPSDVVSLPKANVAAVVVESLGQGSHAALLAREKGIPMITEFPGHSLAHHWRHGTLGRRLSRHAADRPEQRDASRFSRADRKMAGHAGALQGGMPRAGTDVGWPIDPRGSQYRHPTTMSSLHSTTAPTASDCCGSSSSISPAHSADRR